MKRIGLVYDLRKDYILEGYTENEVAEFDSESTIDALADAIRANGFVPERIGHGRALAARLVAGERWDLVFSIAEGLSGRSREAQVPALLELYAQPYTFSDPLTCAVSLDKAVTKRLVVSAGLHTPAFAVVQTPADINNISLWFPVFAKPIAEGTGKGIDARSKIDSIDQLDTVCRFLLAEYRQPVLVEEYLPGREFTTAVIGTGENARAVGTMEVTIRQEGRTADYSYEMKERCEELVHYSHLPHGELRAQIEQLALEAHRTLQARDASRSDIRLDPQGRPAFMEINVLPGLNPSHSDLPMIATAAGISYENLIGEIITSALSRSVSARPVELAAL